jgi:hypothetical protein
MDGACSTHGRDECIKFLVEKPGGRDHMEFLGVRGSTTFKTDLREIGWEIVVCIHLAQCGDQ